MSGQGYPECHLKDWPMTSPGAPTDSNLLVHWPWIQAKPWCTGKQLPLGFNPMDPLITDSNLLVLSFIRLCGGKLNQNDFSR